MIEVVPTKTIDNDHGTAATFTRSDDDELPQSSGRATHSSRHVRALVPRGRSVVTVRRGPTGRRVGCLGRPGPEANLVRSGAGRLLEPRHTPEPGKIISDSGRHEP